MARHDDLLGQAMKGEAEENSPGFSPDLHERIVRGLDRARGDVPMRMGRRRWPVYGSVAAAALVGIGIWLARGHGPEKQREVVVQRTPPSIPTEAIFSEAGKVSEKAEAKLAECRLAYLDEDARKLAKFLGSQLDVLPRGEKRE